MAVTIEYLQGSGGTSKGIARKSNITNIALVVCSPTAQTPPLFCRTSQWLRGQNATLIIYRQVSGQMDFPVRAPLRTAAFATTGPACGRPKRPQRERAQTCMKEQGQSCRIKKSKATLLATAIVRTLSISLLLPLLPSTFSAPALSSVWHGPKMTETADNGEKSGDDDKAGRGRSASFRDLRNQSWDGERDDDCLFVFLPSRSMLCSTFLFSLSLAWHSVGSGRDASLFDHNGRDERVKKEGGKEGTLMDFRLWRQIEDGPSLPLRLFHRRENCGHFTPRSGGRREPSHCEAFIEVQTAFLTFLYMAPYGTLKKFPCSACCRLAPHQNAEEQKGGPDPEV